MVSASLLNTRRGRGSAQNLIQCAAIQGLVEAVGVSNYGPKQMQKIHRYPASRLSTKDPNKLSCCCAQAWRAGNCFVLLANCHKVCLHLQIFRAKFSARDILGTLSCSPMAWQVSAEGRRTAGDGAGAVLAHQPRPRPDAHTGGVPRPWHHPDRLLSPRPGCGATRTPLSVVVMASCAPG